MSAGDPRTQDLINKLLPGLTAEFLGFRSHIEGATAFTPTYYGGTAAGVTTYTIQAGRYVRFGPLVVCVGRVAWSAATGTGGARIGGLPHAAINVTDLIFPVTLWLNGATWGGAGTVSSYRVDAGANFMSLEVATSNAGVGGIAVEAAGDIAFQCSYFIDT